jgi:hypothetical protein
MSKIQHWSEARTEAEEAEWWDENLERLLLEAAAIRKERK